MDDATIRTTDAGNWPWTCLRCKGTIYHDALYCSQCERRARNAARGARSGGQSPSFVADLVRWMRRQSYPGYTLRISVIAGIELLLTAFWMQLLWIGPDAVLTGLPI